MPRTETEIVADNLRRAMALDDISGAQLGRQSGVSQRMISYLTRHERHPTVDVIGALARALRLEPWHLLIPDLDIQAARSGEVSRIVALYQQANRETRAYLAKVAEHPRILRALTINRARASASAGAETSQRNT